MMINEQRWFAFSLCEKMGHIGSEISRARVWDDKKDAVSRGKSLERALDLIDLTKNDPGLQGRRREICYLREVIADQYINGSVYDTSLVGLEQYCTEFALVARKHN